jgi:spore coat protein U-like protein
MKAFNLKALVAAVAMIGCASAMAGSQNATMTNTATVVNSCSITAQGFSTPYNPIATSPAQAQGTVSYSCANSGSTASIALDEGANGSGNGTATPLRNLKSGSNMLPYNLYLDSAYANVWGNDPDVNEYTGLTQDGNTYSVTVYGQIPAGATAPVGTYTDTVTATINF